MVQEFCNLSVNIVFQVLMNLSHKELKKLNLKNNDSAAKISWYILSFAFSIYISSSFLAEVTLQMYL